MAATQMQRKMEKNKELYEYLMSTKTMSSHTLSRTSTVYGTEYVPNKDILNE